jgi:dTMP kinase
MITAFEGIDACGKATQVGMLMAHCANNLIPYSAHSYPDYETETGKKIEELLKLPDGERDGLLLQSLMTVNRYESQHLLEEAHARGELVILDRYWVSGLVYGQTDGLDRDWLVRVHNKLIQPHQWIILDTSVEESFRRRPAREDAYEASHDRLTNCRKLYLQAASEILPQLDGTQVEVLNGMNTPMEIHRAVLRCCEL